MRNKILILFLLVVVCLIMTSCNTAPAIPSAEEERTIIIQKAFEDMYYDIDEYDMSEIQLNNVFEEKNKEITLYSMLIPEDGLYLVYVKKADGIIIKVNVESRLI